MNPTPLRIVAMWEPGTRVEFVSDERTMGGTLVRVVWGASVPYAIVDWDSGYRGRHTATMLREVTP